METQQIRTKPDKKWRKAMKREVRAEVRAERALKKSMKRMAAQEKADAKAGLRAGSRQRRAALKAAPRGETRKQARARWKYGQKLRRRPRALAAWALALLLLGGVVGWGYLRDARPESEEIRSVKAASRLVAEQIEAEGIVLLQNDGGALPLGTKPVNVFGSVAAQPYYSGGGAGAVNDRNAVDLFAAFDERGVAYNRTLYNLYANFVDSGKITAEPYARKTAPSLIDVFLPNIAGLLVGAPDELPASELEPYMADARAFSDTALVVLGRSGMETVDFSADELRLSEAETKLIDLVCAAFDHVILMVNSGNVMQLECVRRYGNIEAVLYVGILGEVGARAAADVLTGAVNPSGRAVDTWPAEIVSAPAVMSLGRHRYANAPDRAFIKYEEGIYVGYRYYETFLSGQNYENTVLYPFGSGLSYTSFLWTLSGFTAGADAITAVVTVTNTGALAGKDVVEVYFEPPYSQSLEKSSANLVAYAKTNLLQPGESQDVTLAFDARDMASYDSQTAGAYVLEEGDYRIFISRDAHTPVIGLDCEIAETIVYGTDEVTGAPIKNLFAQAQEGLTCLSRSNRAATWPSVPDGGETISEAALAASSLPLEARGDAVPLTGRDGGVVLADLGGLAYDDPLWETFLDQFTAGEMMELVANGAFKSVAIERLGVPETVMLDGPACIKSYFKTWASVAYPIEVVAASTWNDALVERMGAAMGREAQAYGVDVIYAPALNMHRTPLGGRNFEYYSEDPLLSGKMAAAFTRGVQAQGTVVALKHFAVNDQETDRAYNGLYTWVGEQALREIYLRPFEIAVKEGGAHGVMSSFTRIGSEWCGGSRALLSDLLRTEWGFAGFVVTDATANDTKGYMRTYDAILSGNDLMLDMATPGRRVKELEAAMQTDPAGVTGGLREAAHNICFAILQTNALAGD